MKEDAIKTCKYEDCNLPINQPHDKQYCVYHAPKENKGISVEKFNDMIYKEKIGKNDFIFRRYVFPGDINFSKDKVEEFKDVDFTEAQFSGYVDFTEAQYSGYADFNGAQFLGKADFNRAKFSGHARFVEAQFSGYTHFEEVQFLGRAHFAEAQFSEYTYFEEVQFSGYADFKGAQFLVKADFTEAQFSGDAGFEEVQFPKEVIFRRAQFSGYTRFVKAKFSGHANFEKAQFSGDAGFMLAQFSGQPYFYEAQFLGIANFKNVQFSGGAIFEKAQFSGDAGFVETQFASNANFDKTQFLKDVYFINNKIHKGMSFDKTLLLKESFFYFWNPHIIMSKEIDIFINFHSIKFLPFKTSFKNIMINETKSQQSLSKISTNFIFRNCQLEDVEFSGNDMSFFSFYNSNFDLARFISCDWGEEKDKILIIPYKRKNVLYEEILIRNIPNNNEEKFRVKYQIENMTLREISSLYRRMKTALDRTKDYPESGWFYFNEFETKRRDLKFGPRKILYYLYKLFTGYGEKPLWSFIWFLIFAAVFSFIHLLNGFYISDTLLKYKLSLTINGLQNIISKGFWTDWIDSITFTLYRLIPVNYMPTATSITPVGKWGLILALSNTFILILMVTFVGIGLKRHFRRF